MLDHHIFGARPAPAYPLDVTTAGNDTRFTLDLTLQVADILTRHGYPPLDSGDDVVRLQHYLFRMIYDLEDRL